MTLAISGLTVQLLVVGFLVICVLMILTVLIQRPQGGGLSGAFGAGGGGAGAGQTAFGARTGDALTIATIAIFIIYLVTAVGLVFAARNFATGGASPVPAASAAPGTATEDLVELGLEEVDGAEGAPEGLTITAVEEAEAEGDGDGGDAANESPEGTPGETPSQPPAPGDGG